MTFPVCRSVLKDKARRNGFGGTFSVDKAILAREGDGADVLWVMKGIDMEIKDSTKVDAEEVLDFVLEYLPPCEKLYLCLSQPRGVKGDFGPAFVSLLMSAPHSYILTFVVTVSDMKHIPRHSSHSWHPTILL